jgi:tRNA(fMet)-specific endonuclease VapC
MTALPRYLLDTNICIYIRRERPQAVLDRFNVLPAGSTAISVITYGELAYGVQKSPDPHKAMMILEELTALIPVVPMATDVAAVYGTIRSDLAARGELIGNNDLWIAAHAKSLDLILVTNNEKEFQRVRGLKVENWTKG